MKSVKGCLLAVGKRFKTLKEQGTANVELALVLSILMGASAPFAKILAPELQELQLDTDRSYILQSLINADVRIAYIDETGDERILDKDMVVAELTRAAAYLNAQTKADEKSEGEDFCVVAAMVNSSGYCAGDVSFFAEADSRSFDGAYNDDLVPLPGDICGSLSSAQASRLKESMQPGSCERRFVVAAFSIKDPDEYAQFVTNSF